MPFFTDLTTARGNILGTLIRGGLNTLGNIIGTGSFQGPGPVYNADICGPDTVFDPITGACKMPVDVVANTTPGYSLACRKPTGLRRQAQCYVSTTGPSGCKRTRRGRYIMTAQGLTCCPLPRRMNPANARALTRAARRLKGFAKLEKRIHKALNRAMGPAGRRMGRSYRPKCGTCKKTRCTC